MGPFVCTYAPGRPAQHFHTWILISAPRYDAMGAYCARRMVPFDKTLLPCLVLGTRGVDAPCCLRKIYAASGKYLEQDADKQGPRSARNLLNV